MIGHSETRNNTSRGRLKRSRIGRLKNTQRPAWQPITSVVVVMQSACEISPCPIPILICLPSPTNTWLTILHIVAAKESPNGRDNYYSRDKEWTHRCQNPVPIDTDPLILQYTCTHIHIFFYVRSCIRETAVWTTCTSNERGWTSLMLHAAMRGCWQTHFLKPVLGCPRTRRPDYVFSIYQSTGLFSLSSGVAWRTYVRLLYNDKKSDSRHTGNLVEWWWGVRSGGTRV